MIILAFDTCLDRISAAVGWSAADGERQMAWANEPCGTGHAERLLPMIREVVARCPLALRDIQRIGVTLGPGTFTGVRTGIAAARALSLATKAPVVGLTSLALVRRRVLEAVSDRSRPLAIAVDARRGEVYLLRPEGTCSSHGRDDATSGDIAVLDPAAGAALLPEGCLVAGSGARLVVEAARAAGRRLEFLAGSFDPDARDIVGLARSLPPLDNVTPIYVRAPDAKPQSGASLPRQ